MKSKVYRNDPLFLRNEFEKCGKWEIPVVKRQNIPCDDIDLIAVSNIKRNEEREHMKEKGVHFYVDDYRFDKFYRFPKRHLKKLQQYSFCLTPDFSSYAEMPLWRQMESVAKNRWVGAYWQKHGIIVVPTISWGTGRSFEFCFDGVEKGSIVSVGMQGCKRNNNTGFMTGYNAMLNKIEPRKIICYGNPFPEMKGDLIVVKQDRNKKERKSNGR